MTYVYYKNDLWIARIAADMLQLLQESNPNFEVHIEKDGKEQMAKVSELEDYSIFRNIQALKNKRR